MITFQCRCSHAFTVPDDEAGQSLQCPSCGLLVDVPTIEELRSLNEDGSYILNDPAAPPPAPRRKSREVKDTPQIVTPDSTDRRMSLDEFLKIGTSDDDLLEIRDEVRPGVPKHPKYDPVTGELILPIEVKAPKAAPPLVAQPVVLGYERAATGKRPASIWHPFVGMFELPNLVVCGVVTAIWYFNMILLVVGFTLLMPLVFVLALLLMTVAHFANVVDETGPTGTDEMPAPLRSANIYDDFIRPLMQVFAAYALAYSPIVLVNLYVTKLPWSVNFGLLAIFFMLVPALLLTLISSGALNNLVPHRALSVITASSWHYWVVTVTGFVATFAFALGSLFGMSAGDAVSRRLFTGPVGARATFFGLPNWLELVLAPIAVFIGVYAVHVFCWQLGTLYRLHHERFNWVLQKHEKTNTGRTDTLAQLHQYRQRQLETQHRKARANLSKRGAVSAHAEIPIAKPVDPKH